MVAEGSGDENKYGRLDTSYFNDISLRMYTLIKARVASMYEMKYIITLDEMLLLYALYQRDRDIEDQRDCYRF